MSIHRSTKYFSGLSGLAYYMRLVNPTATLGYDEIRENGVVGAPVGNSGQLVTVIQLC